MVIALFFEMHPKPGHLDHYFAHVERLRPHLARHEGLLRIERFRRLDDSNAILSFQLWQDEDAILKWRRDDAHRVSQAAGRNVHFSDYRIRVGPEVPDNDKLDPTGRFVAVRTGEDKPDGTGAAHFESVTQAGRYLSLRDLDARKPLDANGADSSIFRINRDYGMRARAEAPADSLGQDPSL